jgi:CMP-N,N'-diacetyllegionaminic acid synthase
MSHQLTVLGIIPARGGSKGVPRKNIQPLSGKPLLAYTTEAALGSRRLTKTILTTDDVEIADLGKSCGVEVPFLRPAELAGDETPMLPVVQHAVRWLEDRGEYFDAVCLLQPTNPFRRSEDIDGCIELLEQSGADAVVTMLPVPAEHNPHWVYFQNADGSFRLSTGEASPISRRQDLPAAFHREGSVYVTRRDVVIEKQSLYGERLVGYMVKPAESANIDTVQDWNRAAAKLSAVGAANNE